MKTNKQNILSEYINEGESSIHFLNQGQSSGANKSFSHAEIQVSAPRQLACYRL
jgi:hypothetical protein